MIKFKHIKLSFKQIRALSETKFIQKIVYQKRIKILIALEQLSRLNNFFYVFEKLPTLSLTFNLQNAKIINAQNRGEN